MRRFLVSAAALSIAATSAVAAQPEPMRASGKITAVTANQVSILTGGKTASFRLSPQTQVIMGHPGKLADIKPGSFIGATNIPTRDGVGQSTEVHVFPPGVKLGEGDRPWGPASATSPASRMTNGTVSGTNARPQSRMTNGAVAKLAQASGNLELDVSYAGGRRHIVVPPTTPVTVMTLGKAAMLKPGMQVMIGSTKASDGADVASFVNVSGDQR